MHTKTEQSLAAITTTLDHFEVLLGSSHQMAKRRPSGTATPPTQQSCKRCLRMPKLPCAHLTLLSSGILTRPRSPALHAYKNRSTSGSNHYDLGPDRGLARQLPPDDGKASGTTKPPKPHCRISKPVFLKLASREFKAALPRNSHQYYAVGSACL